MIFALGEPSTFADGTGAEQLTAADVTLVEYPDLGEQVREANKLQLGQ